MARIVLHAAMAQQGKELVFEIAPAVVHLLVADVSPYDRYLGWTDAERSVSLLPSKLRSHPPRGSTLELLDRLGQRNFRGQQKQEVDVVGGTTGLDQAEAFAFGDTAEVSIEAAPAVRSDQRPALLRAEDAVNEIARVGMSHGSTVPPGLSSLFACVPRAE